MRVKELIQALRCFDEDHHVTIQNENMYRSFDCEITGIIFNGQCTIKTISDEE